MQVRTGWVIGAAALVLILEAFVGCGGKPKGETDGGKTSNQNDGGTLTITTRALPQGVAGEDFQAQLTATGGEGALTWTLAAADPAIRDWLVLDAQSGLLHRRSDDADPQTLFPDGGTQVGVQVADGALHVATATFPLTVLCEEGKSSGCFSPSAPVCDLGTKTCIDGELGACKAIEQGLNTSHDFEHCGPHCEACGETSTQCTAGICTCGAEADCADGGAVCCPGATPVCSHLADPGHCGSCSNDCATNPGAGAHEAPVCTNQQCVFKCAAPFQNCGAPNPDIGDGGAGCGTDTSLDVNHCGQCGTACLAHTNTTKSCGASLCHYACTDGWGDCAHPGHTGDVDINGCATPTATDATNCGTCGHVCPGPPQPSHGGPSCEGGSCTVGCFAGFATCDGAVGACGYVLSSDHDNCGRCGHECLDNATCIQGACHVN